MDYSSSNKIQVSETKISFKDDIKKELLEMSKKFFSNSKISKSTDKEEFDLKPIKLLSKDVVVNRNGFKNDYVFCYLNVVIQALLSVHPFTACFT